MEKKTRKGHGGRRDGAGRKPKPITLARRAIVKDKISVAEAAFALHEKVLFDSELSLAGRIAVAQWIWENVMGKPIQRTDDGNAEEYRAWREKVIKSLGLGTTGEAQKGQL